MSPVEEEELWFSQENVSKKLVLGKAPNLESVEENLVQLGRINGQCGLKVPVVLLVEKERSLLQEHVWKELVLGKVPELKVVKKKFVQFGQNGGKVGVVLPVEMELKYPEDIV